MNKKVVDHGPQALVIGIIIGYFIRHFFPPKEMTTGGWIITGIVWFFAIILIWAEFSRYRDRVKTKEKENNSSKKD